MLIKLSGAKPTPTNVMFQNCEADFSLHCHALVLSIDFGSKVDDRILHGRSLRLLA